MEYQGDPYVDEMRRSRGPMGSRAVPIRKDVLMRWADHFDAMARELHRRREQELSAVTDTPATVYHAIEDDVANVALQSVKRGPGRPRKHPLPEVTA